MSESGPMKFAAGILRMLGEDPERWARRYGIEPVLAECEVCGATVVTTIPIAYGRLRGLGAERCACGAYTPLFTYAQARAGRG